MYTHSAFQINKCLEGEGAEVPAISCTSIPPPLDLGMPLSLPPISWASAPMYSGDGRIPAHLQESFPLKFVLFLKPTPRPEHTAFGSFCGSLVLSWLHLLPFASPSRCLQPEDLPALTSSTTQVQELELRPHSLPASDLEKSRVPPYTKLLG